MFASEHTVLSVFRLRPRRIGGIETMARELSDQLRLLGWKSVLCFQEEPTDAVREFLALPNVHFETIPVLSAWHRGANAQFVRLLRRYHPSVLHLNFVDLLSPYAWVARLYGVDKVFFTDHISRPAGPRFERAAIWKRAAYRAAVPAARVFCVSDYLREAWLESGRLPSRKLATVYNGVDVQRCQQSLGRAAQFRRKHAIPQACTLVGQVASMIPEKGWHDLIRASQQVIDQEPDTWFVFAGDGPSRQQYEELASSVGVSRQVVFTGLIDDPVGQGLFAATDILCQASRWNEAFGLVIAEAMACGKPVVATRVGGIPELVVGGVTGSLIDSGDPNSLAQRIIELVRDHDLRQRYGEAGRHRCEELFDHRRNAAQIIAHYGLTHNTAASTTNC